MSTFHVRDLEDRDHEAVLAINAANVPEVGQLDPDKLGMFASEADWLPVVEVDGEVVAFAVFLTEGTGYGSPNYRWFGERHERFYYVDRIAVADGSRSAGIGRALYRGAVERAASTGRGVFCAEVNTIPANLPSLRFHDRFGFREVARKRPYDPDAEVAMLELTVDAG